MAIICDNGPEFDSQAVDLWAYQNGVIISFIEPGKPIQNAYIESFNGKFRDECLIYIGLHLLNMLVVKLNYGGKIITNIDHTHH